MGEPVNVSIPLDLSRYLREYRGMDDEGDPIEGPITIEDIVVNRAAQITADRIDAEARKGACEKVPDLVKSTQREVVAAIVTDRTNEVIDSPFRPTSAFGEPTGEPTTFRALIAESVQKALTERVKNPEARRYNYDDPTHTLISWAVQAAVKAEVTAQVTAAVQESKADVLAAVKAEAGNVLTEALARVIR